MIGGAPCLVWGGMGKTQSLQISRLNEDIKKANRIGCIDIVIKTFRKKHLLMAILSMDIAHISSKEQWCCVSYNDI